MLLSQLIKSLNLPTLSNCPRAARRKGLRAANVAAEVLEIRQVPSAVLERGVVTSTIDLRPGSLPPSSPPVAVSAALENQGSPIIFGTNSGYRMTLQSESSAFKHQIGRKEGTGWSVNVNDTPNRFMSYGPYTKAVPAGNRTATFRLQLDNVTAGNDRILTVDVFDADSGRVLGQREIRRGDFSSAFQYKDFNVGFKAEAGHRLEFRTYWHGGSYVKQDNVTIR